MDDVLLKIENLKKYFPIGGNKVLKALDGISFNVKRGEVLGLVGESGCGKSTAGKAIVRLHPATEGKIYYDGTDISTLQKKEAIGYCKKVQMIFQNPYGTLNPRMTVGEIIGEGLKFHFHYEKNELQGKIFDLLKMVGLNRDHYSRFPHEFSGGQRQRIGIARALSVSPEFIVCDEPISALDVSIQAQVVNLLIDLKNSMNLTYLFISHDLNIVRYISDRIVVMYLGNVVEIVNVEESNTWLHPYSQALISSVPVPDPKIERARKRMILQGEIPSPVNTPEYCHFYERCSKASASCKDSIPKLSEVKPNHFVACHLYD